MLSKYRSARTQLSITCRDENGAAALTASTRGQSSYNDQKLGVLASVQTLHRQCAIDSQPNSRRLPYLVCLTAQYEAQQLQQRQPRLQVSDLVPVVLEQMPRDADQLPKPIDDQRWAAKKKQQQSYSLYLQQVQNKLQESFATPAEYDQQLVYQVGLTEQWLQLKLLFDTFAAHMTPAVLGALCRRLPDIAAQKTQATFSSSEAREFKQFIGQIFQTCRSLSHRCPVPSSASILYCMAVLDSYDSHLCEALVQSIRPQLVHAAPAHVAQIVWALGTMGHQPGREWLEHLCGMCEGSLGSFQPNQLWGILLGLSLLGFVPRSSWLDSHLSCVHSQLKDFNAEGLGNVIQAVSIMQYKPQKLWLRAFVGMCNHKIKSFSALHLTQLVAGVAGLGYLPRPEVQLAILGQIRRKFHTFLPSQLATLIISIASISGWRPYRQFLYDFVSYSREKMAGWSTTQGCQVLKAFARLEVIPEDDYAIQLLLRVQQLLSSATPANLADCIWALGCFRRRPSPDWLNSWFERAAETVQEFEAQDIAASFWAFATLKLQPDEHLIQMLLNQMLSKMSEASTAELSQLLLALADLKYQPPEEWTDALSDEISSRMPGMAGDEYGDAIYALATLGAGLDAEWLSQLERESYRQLTHMTAASLVRLLWGMAQFGYQPRAEKWWPTCFRLLEASCFDLSAKSLALLLVALGDLISTAPPLELQQKLVKAIKSRFPKPAGSGMLVPMLQKAALLPEEGEHLPQVLWLERFVLELRRSWGLPGPAL